MLFMMNFDTIMAYFSGYLFLLSLVVIIHLRMFLFLMRYKNSKINDLVRNRIVVS